MPDWYVAIHPFARVPALVHDDFQIYESSAIMRYVDEAFSGPALMPPDARGRARVAQLVAIIDAHLYRPLIWDIYVERCDAPTEGRATDEGKLAAAIPRGETCLAAITDLAVPDGPFLLRERLTLADLHLAPMVSLGSRAAEGAALMRAHPRLSAWWERMRGRPSLTATASRSDG